MFDRLTRFFDFVGYIFQSENLHGIHSPFMYQWAERILYHQEEKRIESIEFQRTLMLQSISKFTDFSLSKFTDAYTLPSKYAFVLHRTMRVFNVKRFYEYGTCTGIETNYAFLGTLKEPIFYHYSDSKDFTNAVKQKTNEIIENLWILDENPPYEIDTWDVHLIHLCADSDAIWNLYDRIRPKIHSHSILIFTNIRNSNEHFTAWKQVSNSAEVTLDIDLFRMGILFFRKEQPKESFLLRY
jgi:hypothetical protein